ncbi:Na+/Picotransporter [Salinisphaera sp. PC39]|uniref:Na/Pi cotransporter family protein n=1 Tax=Salinisphaera sp. PC39 TaxID=1304156 RepID=UPI00333F3E73
MIDWQLAGSALGGIGLLLLGMATMTEGLRVAAGQALRTILARATGRPLRAVASGVLITGVVQSSSAVTVATIGFVNAGLLGLAQAVPVIYGSNVGTTATAWLVALIGFHVDVRLLALPLIGIGMLLRVFAGQRRAGAIGLALVGFGVFFAGIDLLREAFADIGARVPLAELVRAGPAGILTALGLGFLLTMLMQSSSAALTVILTVAGGGMVSLPSAAVMVIGANIGTTSTALIAVLGATPNAKRAAAAHLVFNLGTGVVALLSLPVLLGVLSLAADGGLAGGGAAAVLALFHTAFNVLGVLLFLPLTPRLVAYLATRFRTAEEDLARPQFLDSTLLGTPALALEALARELDRAAGISRGIAVAALRGETAPARLGAERAAVDRLLDVIGDYCERLQRGSMPPEEAEAMTYALRTVRDIEDTLLAARTVVDLGAELPALPAGPGEAVAGFAEHAVACLRRDAPLDETALEERYQTVKTRLLQAGPAVAVRSIVRHVDRLSAMRRCVREADKARRRLASMRERAAGRVAEVA